MREPTVRLDHIGKARAPVIVTGKFHPDPRGLVARAETQGGFSASSKFYPGVRAQGTIEYVRIVRDRLRALLPQMFGAPHDVIPTECSFSLVKYLNGSTDLFECIAGYDAAFNRALVYRGTSLHSGSIPADFVLDPNPRTGRLTVNSFLQLHPARAERTRA